MGLLVRKVAIGLMLFVAMGCSRSAEDNSKSVASPPISSPATPGIDSLKSLAKAFNKNFNAITQPQAPAAGDRVITVTTEQGVVDIKKNDSLAYPVVGIVILTQHFTSDNAVTGYHGAHIDKFTFTFIPSGRKWELLSLEKEVMFDSIGVSRVGSRQTIMPYPELVNAVEASQ